MKRKGIILGISAFVVCMSFSTVYAYDDKITHRQITERAVMVSELDAYLTSSFGLASGYKELVNGKEIIQWFSDGAELEDDPMCRASNHFHDPLPLKTWNQSFMTDDDTTIMGSGVRTYCNEEGWNYANRKSNVTWATGFLAPSPDGARAVFSTDPEYAPINWDTARNYYYDALTSTSEADREANFAETFKTVGHVMHLLEDAAQPAHVRNDFTSHLVFQEINGFKFWKWYGSSYEHYVKNHPNLVTSAVPVPPEFVNPGLTDFWDTNQYDGSNPSSSKSIGLAEYTNANYFSDKTIPNNSPTPEHTYPSPSLSMVDHQICVSTAPDSTDLRKYVSRTDGGGCLSETDHFATPSLLNIEDVITDINIPYLRLWLDDNVYNTYAKELLPLAIGYSAKLLDYFFRGDIDLEAQGGSEYVIVHNTAEDMDGIFEVYYDDINDERQLLWSTPGNLFLDALSRSSSFNLPSPYEAKEAGKYILVFKGKLGNEDNAVVGKVVESVGLINTSGGDSYDLAAAGTGGNVTIQADVALSSVTATGSLLVPSGATVNLSGIQEYVDVQISGTVQATGSLTLRSSGSFILSKGGLISVENGLDGGPLTIESEGMILISGTIDTSGRNAESYDIGYGGSGGEVIVQTSYPGVLRVPTIVTRGGDADSADVTSDPIDSQGGRGGDVMISSTSTNIILSGDPPPVDTLPLPPPYNICAVGSGCPAAGELLPLQKATFSGGGSQVGFSRGILTSGGIGGAGICTSINNRDGGRGGDGGNISISSQSGVISFRDVDLITGADVEMVYSLIYLPDYAGAQNIYYAPTGSLGGKGLGACTKGGGSGGTGGNAGLISVSGTLQPAPVSFSSMGGPSDFGNILGFNGERPRETDDYKLDFVIGQTIQAMDSDGSKLYRLRVDGADRTLGGSGGIPAGDATSFPGYFGLQGAGGSIYGLRIQ